MVAATALQVVPKYFPEELDLPLPSDHKTWHTERLCPPLLAQALGSERRAMFVAQLHYWLQKEDVGIYKEGFHWIYNAAWEWQEQFPWMSKHTVGRIRRSLELLGYVVSNNFSRNPFDRKKYSTLDYYRIAVETGWNPLGLDLNRSYKSPPQFMKGLQLRGRHLSDSTPLVYPTLAPGKPESLKPPKIDDFARLQNASCTSATMHSATLPISSIYKELPNTSKSNPAIDLKIDGEETDKGVGQVSIKAVESAPHKANGQQAADEVAQPSIQEQYCAAPSLSSDKEIKANQQLVAALNALVEQQELDLPQRRQLLSKPIRIPELDEAAHEILWQHQETLEQLNVDLHAKRLHYAIADNQEHLEDAILALIENSALGAKTQENATGYLYNALRHGWKPRQKGSSASVQVQVYTLPPQMLEEPKPSTLVELVERKRAAWLNATILRPSIEAWVEQTRGVIMTPNGPALADATNTPSQLDPETNAPEPTDLNQSSFPVASNHTTPAASAQTEPRCHQLPAAGNYEEESLSSAAVELPPNPLSAKPKAQQQPSNRRFQPVEILTSAGEWVAGYFVHSCIAVANLVGLERHYTLFDASGQTYVFRGLLRPRQNNAGAT
jgi:hypothetical protein